MRSYDVARALDRLDQARTPEEFAVQDKVVRKCLKAYEISLLRRKPGGATETYVSLWERYQNIGLKLPCPISLKDRKSFEGIDLEKIERTFSRSLRKAYYYQNLFASIKPARR
jgi:hypothetical protein